jgi:RecA-family ATPase
MENQDNNPNQRQDKEPKLDWNLLSHEESYELDIKEKIKLIKERMQVAKNSKGLFKIQSANKWIEQAKTTSTPFMLFSELWHENELCIMFADTNVGKSIIAVQIGDSISKGESIKGFKLETDSQKVLYFDFELTAKQFETRYSIKNEESMKLENHYQFNDNFKRVEINPDADIPEDSKFEDFLIESLEKSVVETNGKVLIIDNITYLNNENEKARNALPLMKQLKALKSKHDLSILVLAHTPKRDSSKPLNKNDLAGSKMLINFCDSCFAIGESHNDNRLRYIKQLKARNTEIVYHEDNVAICQLYKTHNFLEFCFISTSTEAEHLKKVSNEDRDEIIQRVKELSEKGMSQRAIANELGISVGAVNKYIKL